jgi:hypothetical protein
MRMRTNMAKAQNAAQVGVLLLALALVGCHAEPQPAAQGLSPQKRQQGKTVNAQLTGYNHTDKTIGAFYVNGNWGGNITPGSGGGSFVCCVPLPDPWQPGMTVTVSWEDHELKTQQRVVPIPQYERKDVGTMNVHFLRNGEVKVFVGMLGLRHPNYPLKGKEAEMPLPPSQRAGH